MEGGGEGENCHVILRPGTNQEAIVGGVYEAMAANEVLVNNSGGGGGWGSAFERDPRAVLDDVREGYVSVASAKRDYGVAIDIEAMQLDEEATRALRAG